MMDTFFEQIVKIRLSAKSLVLRGLLWATTFLLATFFIFVSLKIPTFFTYIIIILFCIMAGAYKLSALFTVEYEYIVTNGEIDIDKIVAKSSRKRLITLNCSEVEVAGKYKPEEHRNKPYKTVYVCCNPDDNAIFLTAHHKKQGHVLLVLAPDDRLLGAIKKSIPRSVSSNL